MIGLMMIIPVHGDDDLTEIIGDGLTFLHFAFLRIPNARRAKGVDLLNRYRYIQMLDVGGIFPSSTSIVFCQIANGTHAVFLYSAKEREISVVNCDGRGRRELFCTTQQQLFHLPPYTPHEKYSIYTHKILYINCIYSIE
jgi:hypothetical protein